MSSSQPIIPQDLQQRTLKTSQLHLLVADWILNHHQPSKQQASYRYKFNLQKILPLPDNLLYNFLVYVCYVKFAFVLDDFNLQQKLKKNLFLKSVYQEQFYHGKWKKQFFFEFSMVYLVKTAAKFVSNFFSSLQINQNLQSQIYIILHNVLIGNQVGTKIFHIISKKYLKPLTLKSKRNPIKASICLKKKDSLITLFKPSSKFISEVMYSESQGNTKSKISDAKENLNYQPQNVNPRKNNFRNKISFIKSDSWQKSNIQNFSQHLKNNLYVAPLPILEPKKIDISEYQQARYSSLEMNDKRKLGESFMKPVKLKTTKITSSMDTILSVNHPNLSRHEQKKPGKILLSRQLNSKHYCLTSSSNHNDSSEKPLAQVLEKDSKSKHNSFKNTGKMSYEEWNQLLGKIRLNSKNSAMFEKENAVLGKSFDSSNHNQTLKEISYDRIFHNEDFRESNGKGTKESIMKRITTQHFPHQYATTNDDRNSDYIQSTSEINDGQYGKLGRYSTTIDTNNQIQIQTQTIQQSLPLFKKQLSSSQQKLSKTSKLKLAKLNFLSQCKTRQRKLIEAGHGGQIKMLMY